MNKQSKSELSLIISNIAEMQNDLNSLISSEQEVFDNLSESQQEGEKGQKITEGIEAMETVVGDLSSAESELESVLND